MKKEKLTSPVKASTQKFVGIEAIIDDILMLSDSSCCVILACGAANFGLLSENEQASMINSYAQLLNSLSFPIQILIISKKMNIQSYLDYIEKKITTQASDVIKKRLESYREFLKNTIKIGSVLEKKFYFIIPFSTFELGVKGSVGKSFNKEYLLKEAKAALYPKRDHLLRLLNKVGLKTKELDENEIIDVFYNLYNPSSSGRKVGPIQEYTQVISASKEENFNQLIIEN